MSSYDPMYDLALAIQYEIMRLKSNIVLIGKRTSFRSCYINEKIHKELPNRQNN